MDFSLRRPHIVFLIWFLQSSFNNARSTGRIIRSIFLFRIYLQPTINHPFSNESFCISKIWFKNPTIFSTSCSKRNYLFQGPISRTMSASFWQDIGQSEFSLPRLICVAFVWNGLLVLSRDGMLVVYTISKVGDGTNLIFYCRASHNYFSFTYRFHCMIFLTMKIFARECCQIFLCFTVQDAIPVSA